MVTHDFLQFELVPPFTPTNVNLHSPFPHEGAVAIQVGALVFVVPDTGQLPPVGSVVDLRPTNTRDQSKSQVQFSEKRQVL